MLSITASLLHDCRRPLSLPSSTIANKPQPSPPPLLSPWSLSHPKSLSTLLTLSHLYADNSFNFSIIAFSSMTSSGPLSPIFNLCQLPPALSHLRLQPSASNLLSHSWPLSTSEARRRPQLNLSCSPAGSRSQWTEGNFFNLFQFLSCCS